MSTPAPGPKIRTAENRNVSEMEISALTLGRRTVAVPLMSVRPATTSHSDSGKIPDDFQPGVGHSKCPSQDYAPDVETGSEVHSSSIGFQAALPQKENESAWTSRNLTNRSKR